MDLSTLIGIVLGFVIIVVSITMDDIKAINNFINMPSLFIVVGGTIMAIVASYPFSILKNIPSHMRILFQGKRFHKYSSVTGYRHNASRVHSTGNCCSNTTGNRCISFNGRTFGSKYVPSCGNTSNSLRA